MKFKRFLTAVLALVMFMCAVPWAAAEYDMPYYIYVDITNQIVTIYRTSDGSIVRQMLTSSGMNDCTPKGTFYLMENGRASERGEWTYFQQYRCWVKYATRIYKGYMFHSLPFAEKDDSTMIEQMVKEFGMPTSHGCMRLRVDDARFIAKECGIGTMVKIYKNDTKEEELRQLLLISSYTGEDGMSYQEFLGYSEDALGSGAAGTQVTDLQYRLTDLGYFEGEITGMYDTNTIAAVKLLQQELGIAQNGISTPELLEVIFSDDAPVSAGRTTLSEGRSGPVVRKLQTALQTIGCYEGDIDSVYDFDVSNAVRTFQAACGYTADGIATAEIQQVLYHQVNQLEQAFGAGSLPAAQLVEEEINMARLESDSNIIIRSQADTESQNLGKLTNGDTMIVNSVSGDWASVTAKGVNGFVKTKYLEPFTQSNIILRFESAGTSYQIGHTMEEYASGAKRVADEFSALYTSGQFTSAASEQVNYATVNTGDDSVGLNLRAIAASDGEVLAQVPNGTSLRVLASENGYTKVGYDEQIGYLLNDYLEFWEGSVDDVESTEQVTEDDTMQYLEEIEGTILAVVVCPDEDDKVALYESGSPDSKVIERLDAGRQVEVLQLGGADDWVLIRYKNLEGYMRDANLQFQLVS